MAERASKLFRETVYHGNAGAGSGFVEIGHRKLKEGGRIGLILPLSAMSGISWKGCRELWRKHYTAVVTVTIAASGSEESAFSADTCVAECMIIGTRSKKPGKDMISVTLYRRPVSPLEGTEIGRRIQSMMADSGIRGIGDGPLGGTPILIGDEKVGEALVTAAGAEPWWTSRIYDHTLAQVAYQLMERRTLALPGVTVPLDGAGPFCLLDDLGKPGPYHLDISGSSSSGGAPRGPFEIKDTTTPQSVNYPVMSAHDEKRERFVEIQANAEGLPRQGVNAKASQILKERFDAIWATRTRLHLSTDTQFNSNALIACLTTRDAVGGRAWPSFVLADKRYEKTVVLWFNSSLGILIFWALSSRSQHGRGSITTSRLREMLCFDPRSLTDADMIAVDTFFDAFKTKSLLDIHECAADPHREELDRFVALHFLHVKPSDLTSVENGLQLLRAKLALEPSISD